MRFLLEPRYADDIQQIVAWVLGPVLLLLACAWNTALVRHAIVRRTALGIVLVAALLGTSANFFQTRNNGGWIHRWDLFHTAIGTKYFAELGYDHLYDCAYVLGRQEDAWAFRKVKEIRNLKTLKYQSTERVLKRSDCTKRFSPERAKQFARDVNAFGGLGLKNHWHEAFKDKGYNGTPFYTLLARLAFDNVPVSYEGLLSLALIDIALLILAIVVITRTRGLLVGLLALAFLSVCFPSRFVHMGGSFLRFDYVAALAMGLCALGSKRILLAGVLLAYASFVRVFPALFVVGALIAYTTQGVGERALPKDAVRFVLGLALGLLLFGGATFLFGRGLHDWQLWWTEVQSHTRHSAAFRVGFKHMFMLDGNLLGDEGFVSFGDKSKLFQGRRIWYWLASALLLLPVVARARRMDPASFAALFGTLAFFVLLIATRYYYAVLVLPLLVDPRTIDERSQRFIAALLFLASASAYALAEWNSHAAFLYNTVVTTQLTVLATGLAVWCGTLVWQDRKRLATPTSSVEGATPG